MQPTSSISLSRPIGYTDGNSFVITEDWSVFIPGLGTINLKKGWRGESSIPRFAWGIVGLSPTSGQVLAAGLIHDWLYATKRVARSMADDVYFVISVVCGATQNQASAMYDSLRWFGWIAWLRIKKSRRDFALSHGDLIKITEEQ